MQQYKVIEKYISIDGEGPSSGELAVFIRFAGCDLRCAWCDTAYSWNEECIPEEMSAVEIYNFIRESAVDNVTLTGGEPLIQENISELIKLLVFDELLTIRIETHGGVAIAPFKEEFRYDSVDFIVDFKLPDSKMMHHMCLENLEAVDIQDSYKFVISSFKDLDKAIEIVRDYHLDDRCHVYFSPVVSLIAPREIAHKMIAEKLNGIKLQLQLHKYIWPEKMRGV